MNTTYRGDIDGLRALAVLGVIFFHFGLFNVSGGFVGVDVFFVISGYLITKQIITELQHGNFSFAAFYMRRLRRLFPAMAAMISAVLLISGLLLTPDHLLSLAKSSIAALFSVSNIFFWSDTGYFAAASETKPLLHTWTLAVEEQFYLIWPALLLLIWTLKRAWLGYLVALILLVVPIIAVELYIETDKAATFFLLPFRLSEFVIGGLIIMAERKYPCDKILADISFLVGLVAILTAFFLFTEATHFPGVAALLPCVGAALMIWAGPSSFLRFITSNPIAIGIGLISYSLYLWHWPVLVLYKYWRFTPLTLLEQLSLLAVSLVLGWLSYQYIEQPFRRVKKLSSHPHRKYLAYCGFIFLALLLVSAWIWRDKGLPWRLQGLPTNYVKQANEIPGKECYSKLKPLFECISGRRDKNPKDTLFLIGDSHAKALRVGITALLGQRYRIINAHTPSCPPLLPAYDVINNGVITGCGKRNQTIQPALQFNGEVIVLAARWSLYLNGAPAGLEDLDGDTFLLSKHGDINSSPVKAEVWLKEGLEKTVAYWLERGKKVIVIAQVPPVGINPVPCLYRPPYLIRSENKTGDCRYFTRQQALKRLQKSDEIIAGVAKKYGILALLPSQKLCPKGQDYCTMFSDQQALLYRDDDHLNNTGSRYLMGLFKNEVAHYLKP